MTFCCKDSKLFWYYQILCQLFSVFLYFLPVTRRKATLAESQRSMREFSVKRTETFSVGFRIPLRKLRVSFP